MNDLSFTGVFLSVISALLLYGLIDFAIKYLKLFHFPGPPPLPLIGNLYMKNCVSKFQRYVVRLRQKYGGAFVFWAANTPFLVVTEAKMIRQILTQSTVFDKGWVYTEKMACVFGLGLITVPSGDIHKAERSLIQRFFVSNFIQQRVGMNVAEVLETFKEVFTPDADLELCNILWLWELITIHIFLSTECGIRGPRWRKHPLRKEMIKMINEGSNVVGNIIFLNLPTNEWLNPQVKRLKKAVLQGQTALDEMYDERERIREKLGDDDKEDVLTVLIDRKLPKEKYYSQMITLISAGFETTAHLGAYTCYLLAKYPDVQEKCKEEIRDVLKGGTDLTPEIVNQLKYLTCVVKESLRMYSIVPSIMRRTTTDVVITSEDGSDLKVPAETNIMLPFAAINHVEEYWEKPSEFNPERFLNVTGESASKHGYFPFGYGVRNCIGSTFAVNEAKIALSLLLQRVTIKLNPNFRPQPTSGISLVSKNGMKLTVEYEDGYGPENISKHTKSK